MTAQLRPSPIPPPAPQSAEPLSVLVVDDSNLQRMMLTKLLRNWGYRVVEAADAESAFGLLEAETPQLIISDWMMPGMKGPEFCRALRKLGSDSYQYFILLTSKSSKQEVAEGLDAGADDFLTKPVNAQELRARLAAGRRVISMEQELQKKNRVIADTLAELQKLYDEIDADLIQARRIQEALIPTRTAQYDGADISLLMKPCGHVGGDLVGMFDAGHQRIGFFSIDVSGHGITSAMMTARVAGYLNAQFPEQNIALERQSDSFSRLRPPEEVARLLNQRLDADPGVSEYLTMAFGTLHTDTGLLRLVQAGHPRPLLRRADGTMTYLGSGGLPVGLITDAAFEGFDVTLRPGDSVLFYSDGFTECETTGGSLLDEEGLVALLSELDETTSGTELLDDLFWRLTLLMPDGAEMADDVSAALLEYYGPK